MPRRLIVGVEALEGGRRPSAIVGRRRPPPSATAVASWRLSRPSRMGIFSQDATMDPFDQPWPKIPIRLSVDWPLSGRGPMGGGRVYHGCCCREVARGDVPLGGIFGRASKSRRAHFSTNYVLVRREA